MTLWDEIHSKLQNEIEDLKKVLANGIPDDYASYKQIVGKIEGISFSMECLSHIVKTRIYEDDFDN